MNTTGLLRTYRKPIHSFLVLALAVTVLLRYSPPKGWEKPSIGATCPWGGKLFPKKYVVERKRNQLWERKKSKIEKKSGNTSETAKTKLSRKEYEAELFKLHAELVKLQYWVKEKGHRAIVVFEGRDAAGDFLHSTVS